MSQVVTVDYLLNCVDRLEEAAKAILKQYSHLCSPEQFVASRLLVDAAAAARGAANQINKLEESLSKS